MSILADDVLNKELLTSGKQRERKRQTGHQWDQHTKGTNNHHKSKGAKVKSQKVQTNINQSKNNQHGMCARGCYSTAISGCCHAHNF